MTVKKLHIFLLLLTAVIITAFLLWPSDESRIKKLFKEGSSAVEAEDIEKVLSKVAFSYHDDNGMTYLYIKDALKRQFDALADIDVEHEKLRITVSEKTAFAEMDVRVIATLGSETGYIIGDIKKPLHLKFTLEKERTKWLIVKSEGFRL
ncbi:MAG: hypothetical protein AABY42_06715 [Nitrospirota bacterium]